MKDATKIQWFPVMNHFQWFRKLLGGAWTPVSGLLFGHWLRVPSFWAPPEKYRINKWEIWAAVMATMLLCSCTDYVHVAQSKSGNYVYDRVRKLGGTISTRSSDGSSMAADDQVSFRDFTVAATTIAGSVASAAITKSQEVTKRAADTNATNLAVQKSKDAAAVEAAKINANQAVTTEAIKAGSVPTVNPITPP